MEVAYRPASDLKEIVIGLIRIFIGLVLLIEGLIFVDFMVYIGATSSTFSEKVVAAYETGYDQGYAKTYEITYQEAHAQAYEKGYSREYEIGLVNVSKEEAAVRVDLHNPTHKELTEFLVGDATNSNEFIHNKYVCFDFAAELNNNAETNGIRSAYVRVRFDGWGHAVVGFETTDKGLVFIEPQSDREVEMVIGESYPWQRVGAVSPTDRNEPVSEIQIIW